MISDNLSGSVMDAVDLLHTKTDAVLLVPTETVYGLVCDWYSTSGRERIYQMKHRDPNKLLAAFLPSLDFVYEFVPTLPETARKIAHAFMPGPITLVVPDGKGGTFGFRIPDHPLLLQLLREYGKVLASTSANRSGEPSTLNVSDALCSLGEKPDYILDSGAISADSKASTVILVDGDDNWKILREGPVSAEAIRQSLE
ncbi:MAG: L-threonylcarbamoyladenylate synthase [Lentisphaeria bacterium]|nr:L-threonylcarbamoyladenylate synthase [Lentisphaeria bacterium]